MAKKTTEQYAAHLQQMIRIETVSDPVCGSPRENVEQFRKMMWEMFPALKNACELQEFEDSVLLKWKGSDASALPVLFMNHHDVVPAPAEGWTHAPFSGDIAEGKIWGRGTLDDKGGLWAMLEAANELAEEGFSPKRDIYLESSSTEETDGRGACKLAEHLEKQGIRFDMVFDEGGDVVYEPIDGANGTFAMVGVGEKCTVDLKFTARSEGGHASTPGKNTPLVRLGKFMAYVDTHRVFDVQMSPTITEMFMRMSPYMGGAGKLTEKADKLKKPLELLLPVLGPAAKALLSTTIAFTMTGGGDAINAIPREAWVKASMRCSHHQGTKGSVKKITKLASKFGLETEIIDGGFESGVTDFNGKAFKLVEEAVKATIPGVDACVPYVTTGASDARYFDRICCHCIRFLPFTINRGQMDSVHGVNECLDLSTLQPAVDFYRYMIQHV